MAAAAAGYRRSSSPFGRYQSYAFLPLYFRRIVKVSPPAQRVPAAYAPTICLREYPPKNSFRRSALALSSLLS